MKSDELFKSIFIFREREIFSLIRNKTTTKNYNKFYTINSYYFNEI